MTATAIEFAYACDDEVMEAFQLCSRLEGIIPALESTHALVHGMKRAKEMRDGRDSGVINLSGRGDKDVKQVAKLLGVKPDIFYRDYADDAGDACETSAQSA